MNNAIEKQQMLTQMQVLLNCVSRPTLRVLLKVLSIAIDLAANGREGKPTSALFIVGDEQGCSKYITQLVLNPLKGYSKNERNIFTNDLDETLRELSWLDGAICIDVDGSAYAAGAMITPPQNPNIKLSYGLGTAHYAAALLTAKILDSVAVKVSSGKVKVIWHGKFLMKF